MLRPEPPSLNSPWLWESGLAGQEWKEQDRGIERRGEQDVADRKEKEGERKWGRQIGKEEEREKQKRHEGEIWGRYVKERKMRNTKEGDREVMTRD